jgi:ribonuclease R
LRITPQHYQRLIKKVVGKPEERIISYLMLRSLKQARYAAEPLGHFALGFDEYTHFTSPIRRYPDLIVHRILKWALEHPNDAPASLKARVATSPGSEAPLYSHKNLEEIAAETSEAERRANGAERELMDWKTAQFMEQHLGEEYDGLIISVQKFGCFVELFEVFVEGLLPINALEEFAGARCVLRERDHAIVALQTGGGRGAGTGRGARGSGSRRASSVSSSVGAARPNPVGAGLASPARIGASSSSHLVTNAGTAALSPGRGAKPRQLEWHLGDKVCVRAERIDPMRKRVEFALIP